MCSSPTDQVKGRKCQKTPFNHLGICIAGYRGFTSVHNVPAEFHRDDSAGGRIAQASSSSSSRGPSRWKSDENVIATKTSSSNNNSDGSGGGEIRRRRKSATWVSYGLETEIAAEKTTFFFSALCRRKERAKLPIYLEGRGSGGEKGARSLFINAHRGFRSPTIFFFCPRRRWE